MAKKLTEQEKYDRAAELDYSRELNFWRMSEYPQVRRVIDTLMEEYLESLKGQNKRRPQKPEKYKEHFKIFALDLYVAHAIDFLQYIYYSRNRSDYNAKSRYQFMSYRITKAVSDFLIETGYIEFVKGFHTDIKSRKSRIRATQKLIWLFNHAQVTRDMIKRNPEEPVVRLRDTEKNLIEFRDIPKVVSMEMELKELNALIEKQEVKLPLTPSDIVYLREYFQQENKVIDTSILRWRRTFLRGTFECGGRLAGGWYQTLPEEYRKRIIIENKPVTELDYESLHPTMLYHSVNKIPPNGGLYYLPDFPKDKISRKFLKMVLLVVINAKDEREALRAIRTLVRKKNIDTPISDMTDISLKPLLESLKKRHKPIAHFFCSDQGVWLHRKESQINMNVMRKFKNKQLPLPLPEYDSFICSVNQAKTLKWAMLESYKEVMGYQYTIGIEKKY